MAIAAQIGQFITQAKGVALGVAALALLAPTMASAQLRALENPSFESNDPAGPGAPSYEILPIAQVLGWDTTTGEIELWDTNFSGVPAYAGNVFAEMNANVNGTFYQNICLINGEPVGWTFAHRARSGGPSTQTVRFQIANSGGTLLQSLATQSSRTSNLVWNVNTGSTTYNGPSGLQRVQFTTSDPGSIGNFLDAIQLTLRPFIQLSATSSSAMESFTSSALPTILVTGRTASPITVNVTITGGTAVRGSDYTTPGGGASFTVTVPAGNYYNSPIPLGISIVDDTTVEGSETITFALSAGTGYTLGHTTNCGSPVLSAGTYTISDNDARVTLRKQWTNAILGDDAVLTIMRDLATLETFASEAGAVNETDIDPTPTPVTIGDTLFLTEALAGSNAGSYRASVSCTGTADTNLADGLTVGAGETAIVCTYTNTRILPLIVSKTSAVLTDGISTSQAKALPGSTIQYCIEVSNPGTLPVSNVYVTDNLPVALVYILGTTRTGTSCAAVSNVEDDDASGSDESDPYGSSFNGTTLVGWTLNLNPGSSFAIAFNALLN